jgi:hypothetical protein
MDPARFVLVVEESKVRPVKVFLFLVRSRAEAAANHVIDPVI